MIDFRSDTITKPTENMRKAMYQAEVGDDVYGEDPTINKLERKASQMLQKEDSIFIPSGTMANQLALLSHTNRGQEVILEDWSHIYRFEAGGLAFLSGLKARPIVGKNGIIDISDIENSINTDDDIHFSQTGLICLENTHNMAGGVVTPIEIMKDIYNLSRENNIPIHLDGARLFNASVYLNKEVKEITQYTDSVMFCLSKGLSAPVGSILSGDKSFIEKARRYRKMLGGGMRQAGILAAAGIVALDEMVDRLSYDHDNIKTLAHGLLNIKGLNVDYDTVQTNILMVNIENTKYNSEELIIKMKQYGVYASKITDKIIRFVSHKDIDRVDINNTINILNKILTI